MAHHEHGPPRGPVPRTRRRLLLSLGTASAAAVAGCQAGSDGTDSGPDTSITFDDQRVSGEVQTQGVVIAEAVLSDGGFVTINDPAKNAGRDIVGVSSYFTEGRHQNVRITLDRKITSTRDLVAIPHRDTDSDNVFRFTGGSDSVDTPYTHDDEPVRDRAKVTVLRDTPVPTESPTQTRTQTPSPDGSSRTETLADRTGAAHSIWTFEKRTEFSLTFDVLSGTPLDVYLGPKEKFWDSEIPGLRRDRDKYESYVKKHAVSGLVFLNARKGDGQAAVAPGSYVLTFRRPDLDKSVTFEYSTDKEIQG